MTQNNPTARILVADDHPVFRRCLIEVLKKIQELEVVGCAEDGWQAVTLTKQLHPHLVLMDVNMPVMDGIEATREIAKAMPEVWIIGLSMHGEDTDVAEQMKTAGAIGYLSKNRSPEILIAAIQSQLALVARH